MSRSRSEVVDQLRALGVESGAVLLVHTSFRSLRRDPLVFLHAADAGCGDCNEARASVRP